MKKRCCAFLVLLCILLGSCQSDTPPSAAGKLLPLDTNEYEYFIAHVEDGLYMGKMVGDDKELFRFAFADGRMTPVGRVENFALNNGSTLKMDNSVYFFATSYEGEGRCNTLYRIDLEGLSTEAVYTDHLYQTFNYMTCFQGRFLTTKGDIIDKENGDAVTYIEEYHPDTGKSVKIMEAMSNQQEVRGETILHITSDDEYLYVYGEKSPDGERTPYIDVYDSDYHLVESYPLEKYKEEVCDQMIGSFLKIGDAFYLLNFSGIGVLFTLEPEPKEIFPPTEELWWAQMTASDTHADPLLYRRLTNEIYYLSEKGDWETVHFAPYGEQYVVSFITQYADKATIWLENREDNRDEKIVYIDLDTLKKGS